MVLELTDPRAAGELPAIDRLLLRLRGALIQPADADYDTVRTVYWSNVDLRPAQIVRAEDEVDVIAAVDYARETGTPVSVRSGGHGFAGYGLVDHGIVVDLSGLKSLRIDPVRRTARVQPGVTWLEYAEAAQAHGLATTSGDVGSVGVGWMVRRYGLTIDHLLSVDIVTADGRLIRASATEHPDLFWAVRGGGGNFGIITSLEFRLEEAGTILGGAVFYPADYEDDAARIVEQAANYAAAAPDELTTMVIVWHAPDVLPFIPAGDINRLTVMVAVCYAGDLAEGERVIAPLRQLGTPTADAIAPMPYPGMFAMMKDIAVPGLRLALRSMYLEGVDAEVARTMVSHTGRGKVGFVFTQLRVLGGAMARVPAEETAFGHRDKPFMLSAITEWEDPAEDAEQQRWAEGLFAALRGRSAGVYVNFLQDEGEARVREAYRPATHARLAAVKAIYDSTNLFRRNQNIKPA